MRHYKAILFLAVATAATTTTLKAQTTWKNPSPFGISYGSQTLEEEETGIKMRSSFSFGMFKRKTYLLSSHPIGDMLMFGIDLNWFEFNMARYAERKGLSLGNLAGMLTGNVTEGTYGSFEDYFNDAYQHAPTDNDYSLDVASAVNRLDMGKMQFTVNLLGVGPSVIVAPFGATSVPVLNKMRVKGYFHYLPTLTALLFTGDGEDNVLCGGYVNRWRAGGSLQFGTFGVGAEYYWGEGDLKRWKLGSDDDEPNKLNVTSEKRRYLMNGVRFYVGINF